MIKIEDVKKNIRDTKEISEKLDFKIILDGGSLLGAYRDKGMIKGDEDDVDFAVPMEVMNFKALEIIKAFQDRGFELFRLRDTVMTFKRYGSKIDLLFYKYDCEVLGEYYYLTLYHNKKPFALKIPCIVWDDLDSIKFMGEKFLCPRNIEEYLKWRFGDWKNPVLRPAFSFDNYLQNTNLTTWL